MYKKILNPKYMFNEPDDPEGANVMVQSADDSDKTYNSYFEAINDLCVSLKNDGCEYEVIDKINRKFLPDSYKDHNFNKVKSKNTFIIFVDRVKEKKLKRSIRIVYHEVHKNFNDLDSKPPFAFQMIYPYLCSTVLAFNGAKNKELVCVIFCPQMKREKFLLEFKDF